MNSDPSGKVNNEQKLEAERQRRLMDKLFSKVDYFLKVENKPDWQARGDAVRGIFDAVAACLPSLADDDSEPPGLAGDVASLLISHAEWMRRRQGQEENPKP